MGLHEFESLPPLGSFDNSRGFIPDFPALLMFDEFVIDFEAYDLIRSPGERAWLRHWTELVDALKSEGVLTVTDVKAAASADPYKRSWMLRRDMKQPEKWWQAMGYFDNLSALAGNFLGEYPETAKKFAWKFDPRQRFGVKGSDGHVHDLSAILVEDAGSRTDAHHQLYGRAIANLRDQLREVNACLTACASLGVSPMMWAPYRRYLHEKLESDARQAMLPADAGALFFKIAFPAYSPTSVREFAKLRFDKRIYDLRTEIKRATRNGSALEPRYAQRILSEVLKIEQKAARVRTIIGWISNVVGTLPIPGVGLGAAALGEGVGAVATNYIKKPWRWFYLISDGRGAT